MGCDLCHGVSADGTEDGPSLLGLLPDDIRAQVRDPQRTDDSPYSRPMKPFTTDKLSDEELEEIILYLLSVS